MPLIKLLLHFDYLQKKSIVNMREANKDHLFFYLKSAFKWHFFMQRKLLWLIKGNPK